MSEIRLTTPDGYFESSFERTIASAERIRKRRKMVLCFSAAVLLIVGAYCSIHNINEMRMEKEYLAQQAEMARLDIFLEVNDRL